jgi:hypothetical protein
LSHLMTPRVSARHFAALLGSRWLTLAVCVVIAAAGGALYALTRAVLYESDSVLAQSDDHASELEGPLAGSLGAIGNLVGGLGLGRGTSVEESVAVLRSREFSLRFMRAHGVLQFLFPRLWDSAAGRWRAVSRTPSLSTRLAQQLAPSAYPVPVPPEGPSEDDAIKAFDALRAVEIDRRTNFVHLSIRGPTPEIAQAWGKTMIEELNDSLRANALEDSRRAIAVLSGKVETEQLQSVRTTAAALLEAQLRNEVSAQSRREFALRVLDPPSLPDQRYYPRRGRMVLIAGGMGLLLGCAYVVLASGWSRRRREGAADGRGA